MEWVLEEKEEVGRGGDVGPFMLELQVSVRRILLASKA